MAFPDASATASADTRLMPRIRRRRLPVRAAPTWLVALTVLGAILVGACEPARDVPPAGTDTPTASDDGTDTPSGEGTRSFALGFTDFPHAVSTDALLEAYSVIEHNGDLVMQHFDGGVPWPEALTGEPFAEVYRREVEGKASVQPDSHLVFLAVTPIRFERDGLASYRGDAANQPLAPPWDTRAFDDPSVIDAYGADVERMIELFEPDYVAYAIETNMLAAASPGLWPAFLSLAEATYARLKAARPRLPVFVTLQADWYHADSVAQGEGISQLLPFTDMIAVSSYAFASPVVHARAGGSASATALVEAIPPDYFSALAALAPQMPFAISETSWPAEPIDAPYPFVINGSPEAQQAYVERLLDEASALDAAFVTWFFTRDFDHQWEQQLQGLSIAPTVRLWRDNGLYDGLGAARLALEVWRATLARPLADHDR